MGGKRVPDDEGQFPKTWELLDVLHTWARPLMEDPALRAFNRAKIGTATDFEGREPLPSSGKAGGFDMPAHIDQQHMAVMQFYYLFSACDRLQQCEFYFRRYHCLVVGLCDEPVFVVTFEQERQIGRPPRRSPRPPRRARARP
jgi:hypothetical protein